MGAIDTAKEIVLRDWWKILLVLPVVLLGGYYLYTNPGAIPDGRLMKLFALSFGVSLMIAAVPVMFIINALYNPNRIHLIDFDGESDDFAHHVLSKRDWRNLDVVEGDLKELNALEPTYHGKNYDPDAGEVEGNWKGSMSDLELASHRENIREIRGELEDMAREGLAIRARQSSVIRAALRDISMTLIRDFETATVYSGEKIQTKIDDLIEDFAPDEDPSQTDSSEPDDSDDPLVEPHVDEDPNIEATTDD